MKQGQFLYVYDSFGRLFAKKVTTGCYTVLFINTSSVYRLQVTTACVRLTTKASHAILRAIGILLFYFSFLYFRELHCTEN
jgi:hypothetical protein